MLAAVSRDDSMLSGGISSSKWTGRGTVYVEPLARITPAGEWIGIPCNNDSTCKKFEREYLSKPHDYAVVSVDGRGATVHSTPTRLGGCEDYTGTGTYIGGSISRSAIAASSTDIFANSEPPKLLDKVEAAPIRKALAALVPEKLDSMLYLRLFSLRLEGQDLIIVQRTFNDYADKPDQNSIKLFFSIGSMKQGRFHLLYWKSDEEDEDQQIVGTIRLQSGREFLITTVSGSESQKFRVYGIRDGKLVVVYTGGGSSC